MVRGRWRVWTGRRRGERAPPHCLQSLIVLGVWSMAQLPAIQLRSATVPSADLRFHLALLQDQATTLYPPRPKAFTSFDDVMNNLVPYHIWQIHDEELAGGKNEDPAGVAAREKAGE